jgi:hypothetical protein
MVKHHCMRQQAGMHGRRAALEPTCLRIEAGHDVLAAAIEQGHQEGELL